MLRAAAEVFGERGYHGASMDEIAARVGVTKPLLYSYFESKEGLFAACGEAAATLLGERVRAAAGRADLAPDMRLWRGLLSVFEFIGEHRELWFAFNPPPGGAVPAGADEIGARGRQAMNALLGELLTDAAIGEGIAPQMAELAAPLAPALTAGVLATAEWWHEHPEEPAELQALRVMNFAWIGFEQLLAGKLWMPRD
ncbi:MAG TPA: helix-turn-helix domain-containing protein [Solirubrobacteraceae bacterium]